MQSLNRFAVALLALSFSLGIGNAIQPSHDDVLGESARTVDAAQLKSTVVTATLETPMKPGTSILWCSTFELAWGKLAEELGSPVTVSGSATAMEMARALTTAPAADKNLDADSYVALAGTNASRVLDRIRAELQSKFKGAASPSILPSQLAGDQILAYSYLFKDLAFAVPFERSTKGLSFGGSQVEAFGVWTDHAKRRDIAAQVVVHQYDAEDRWAIEFATKSSEDRLLIVRQGSCDSLDKAVLEAMQTIRQGHPSQMSLADTLRLPIMNFDITRKFTELHGAHCAGKRATGQIFEAMQNIRFKLDETGALLKSEAELAVLSTPRHFVCDGPFLLIMMRKDAEQPYFVAAIESPELLVPLRKD